MAERPAQVRRGSDGQGKRQVDSESVTSRSSPAQVGRAGQKTGRFRVSDCQRGPKPARYDEAVQVKGAALMRLTLFENQQSFNAL